MSQVERDYLLLLRELLESGEPHADRTGVGTRCLWGRQLRADVRQGFPLLTTKQVWFRGIAEELRWFLLGRSDVKWLQERKVHIWDEWAVASNGREAGDMGPIYGPMWRNFPIGHFHKQDGTWEIASRLSGYDQIQQLLDDLHSNPLSRRHVVSAWHPYWSRKSALPPCHVLWQLKVHAGTGVCGEDELSIAVYMRSLDVFLGLPFDLASYALLLCLLAKVTGRQPRDVVIFAADIHLYDNHREQTRTQLTRQPLTLPAISLGQNGPDSLTDFEYNLVGYNPHPKLSAAVAV